MKILMLVNWKVKFCSEIPVDKQPPDYFIKSQPYWFYRYFESHPDVNVVDIHSFPWLEYFEHEKLRFYIVQALKVLPQLNKYDLIVSHGMQSGVVIALWRRFFKTKAKHIVFDIGSFNSAAESGIALKLMQFASKSIDGFIYHTSSQLRYYEKIYPWIVDKSKFIRFGADLDYFNPKEMRRSNDENQYILCVGAGKRDWDTLVKAYEKTSTNLKLRIIGHVNNKYTLNSRIEQIGWIPINQLTNEIYNAAFCVLPLEVFNYSYGQMTFLQQIALGKCVIAARVPSLINYIEEDKTALMYTPKDVDDLANKIQWLANNPKKREVIALTGKEYLKKNCSEKIMSKQIEEFMLTIL